MHVIDLQRISHLVEHFGALVQQAQNAHTGGALDAANTRRHAGLTQNLEAAQLRGVLYVGTAAEFGGVSFDVHNPYDLAVLLAKQGHSAHLLGLSQRQVAHSYIHRGKDLLVYDVLYQRNLLRGHRAEVGKVKTYPFVILVGTSLMHMVAQHIAQRLLQQMSTGMVAGDGTAAALVHRSGHSLAHLDHAAFQHTGMNKIPFRSLLHIQNFQAGVAAGQGALVGHLAAHFRIERSVIQHHQNAFLGAIVGRNRVFQALFIRQSQHSGLFSQGIITGESGGSRIQFPEDIRSPARNITAQTILAGLLLLLLHFDAEVLFIHQDTRFGRDFLGQIQRETERIVQLESIQTGQNLFLTFQRGLFDAVNQAAQDCHALINGLVEPLFLGADDLLDVIGVFFQFGIAGLVFMDNGIHQFGQERTVDAQHPAMAGSAAQQTAQHIAAALIRRQNAVADHKGGGTNVVGDHADGDIGLFILTVGLAADAFHMMQDRLHGVHFKQVAHALHHASQALQTHTGIDVGLFQAGIVALAVGIELAEDQVPDFHVTVAVTADLAVGLTTAMFRSTVKVDFAAGTAGAGTMLPEVVFLAKTDHVAGINAHFIDPDIPSLIVLFIHRDVQQVSGDLQHLGQELPGPGSGFPFEIVLEAEIAQHFKIGTVTGSNANPLDIRRTDALLAGGHPVTGRLLLAEEPLLHGGHTAVDQQQAVVVLRNQRKAAQAQMALALKKAQVLFTQFVQSSPLHCVISPFLITNRATKNSLRPCYWDEG